VTAPDRPSQGLRSPVVAVGLGVVTAIAVAISVMRVVLAGRRDVEREAELDDWAFSGSDEPR
jgi:hypothetical protein